MRTADENAQEENGEEDVAAEEATKDRDAEQEDATDDVTEDSDVEGESAPADGDAPEGAELDEDAEGEEGEEEESEPPPSLLQRFDHILHEAFANESSPVYLVVSNFIIMLILLSIVLILLESIPEIHADYETYFTYAEYIVVGIFILEYFANMYVAKPTTSYVFGVWGVIDFVAIAPSLITWVNLSWLRGARLIRFARLLRLLRLLKLTKDAGNDIKRLIGVASLGVGVGLLAAGILLREQLPDTARNFAIIAGFVLAGTGDLVYLGTLHLKPLTEEEKLRRARLAFLDRSKGMREEAPE